MVLSGEEMSMGEQSNRQGKYNPSNVSSHIFTSVSRDGSISEK